MAILGEEAQGTASSSATVSSTDHTMEAGTSRLILASVTWEDATVGTITGVQFDPAGGDEANFVEIRSDIGTFNGGSLWYLHLDDGVATSGDMTITATADASKSSIAIHTQTVIDLGHLTPETHDGTNVETGTPLDVSLTVAAGAFVWNLANANATENTLTLAGDQTAEVANVNSSAHKYAVAWLSSGSGSVAMDYDMTLSARGSNSAVSFVAAATVVGGSGGGCRTFEKQPKMLRNVDQATAPPPPLVQSLPTLTGFGFPRTPSVESLDQIASGVRYVFEAFVSSTNPVKIPAQDYKAHMPGLERDCPLPPPPGSAGMATGKTFSMVSRIARRVRR